MGYRHIVTFACVLLSFAACSDDSNDPDNTGSGGSSGSAGKAGSGGTSGGGGTNAGGGAGKGSAGNDSGGTAGTGGAAGAPVARVNTCTGPASTALEGAALPPGYCAWTWAEAAQPRGIFMLPTGEALVLERSENRVALLHDDNGDGVSGDDERVELASAPGLNHGVSVSGGYLYASSDTTVYRWAYDGGREPLGAPEAAVTNLPAGEHATRTVVFDSQGRLYVSVGSQANVDPDSRRARIVRFTPEQLASGATFEDGEVFADGLRNEVGLDFDAQGRLWGVENGLDKLNRTDLGGDIHNDNPGEELNLFAEPGKFYGYPQCWSEFLLPENLGIGPGTQWATPEMDFFDAVQTDAWCRDPANVVPPQLSMQAHSAPLDLKFYTGGSFPNDVIGDVFISFHGSWNRDAATGYKVVRVPMDASGKPEGMPVDVLASDGGNWPHRPVGIGVGKQGQLLVTSDASNVVIAIGHDGT